MALEEVLGELITGVLIEEQLRIVEPSCRFGHNMLRIITQIQVLGAHQTRAALSIARYASPSALA